MKLRIDQYVFSVGEVDHHHLHVWMASKQLKGPFEKQKGDS